MIDGITNTPEAAFPRLGLLRKGAPKRKVISKKTGKEIEVAGEDLDHFRFVCDNPAAMARFHEVYGDKPRAINVFLPFGTKDENLDAWMKEYGAGSLKVKCTRPKDGKDGIVLWQDGNGQFHEEPKQCQWPNCACKPYGVLTIIIPELVTVAGIGAVWALTTAWNDCVELSRNLAAAEGTANRLGKDLRGIPFILSRRLEDVSTPPRKDENGNSTGKRIRDEKWMLHIEPDPVWVAMQLEAFKRLASPLEVAQIEAPASAMNEFDEVFADEADDEIIEAEPVEQPEPTGPPTNGNQQPQAGLPITAPDLLRYVNERVQVPFDNLVSLREALASEGLTGNNWPNANRNPQWWVDAKAKAIEHAQCKEVA